MRFEVIIEIVDYFEKEFDYEILLRMLFVGRVFNVIRVGIYVDGILKDEEIYNIFDIKKILNCLIVIVVDVYFGFVGIVVWINIYFRFEGDKKIDKCDFRVVKIKEWVDKEYENGRIIVIGDDEFEMVVCEVMLEFFKMYESRVK